MNMFDDSTTFEICNQSIVYVIHDSANVDDQLSCINNRRINTSDTKQMVTCFRKDKTFVDFPKTIFPGYQFQGRTQGRHKFFNSVVFGTLLERLIIDKYFSS